ncbi:hypothetical protein M0R45_025335 [Rubus argutus]|uniref:Uncharacterized protein n=1 Tax=Rubus argutus TaxID=59490 RepID=A0AAW1WVR6_RUBAR
MEAQRRRRCSWALISGVMAEESSDKGSDGGLGCVVDVGLKRLEACGGCGWRTRAAVLQQLGDARLGLGGGDDTWADRH